MSSAENGKPAGRLVWITDEQKRAIERTASSGRQRIRDLRGADAICASYEAAPADAEAAIQQALLSDGRLANIPPSAVLQALGVPSSSPTRSDNP